MLVERLECWVLKKRDGGIAGGICLGEDDVERLRTGDELSGFAKSGGWGE